MWSSLVLCGDLGGGWVRGQRPGGKEISVHIELIHAVVPAETKTDTEAIILQLKTNVKSY